MIKKINRLEEKQRNLIDKITYNDLSTKKKYFIKREIYSKMKLVERVKKYIELGVRESRGSLA